MQTRPLHLRKIKPRIIFYCTFCSQPPTSHSYSEEVLKKAVEKILECLSVPEGCLEDRSWLSYSAFCPSCLEVVSQVINFQAEMKTVDLKINHCAQMLGEVVRGNRARSQRIERGVVPVGPLGVVRSTEIRKKLQGRIFENYMEGKLPNPSVVLTRLRSQDLKKYIDAKKRKLALLKKRVKRMKVGNPDEPVPNKIGQKRKTDIINEDEALSIKKIKREVPPHPEVDVEMPKRKRGRPRLNKSSVPVTRNNSSMDELIPSKPRAGAKFSAIPNKSISYKKSPRKYLKVNRKITFVKKSQPVSDEISSDEASDEDNDGSSGNDSEDLFTEVKIPKSKVPFIKKEEVFEQKIKTQHSLKESCANGDKDHDDHVQQNINESEDTPASDGEVVIELTKVDGEEPQESDAEKCKNWVEDIEHNPAWVFMRQPEYELFDVDLELNETEYDFQKYYNLFSTDFAHCLLCSEKVVSADANVENAIRTHILHSHFEDSTSYTPNAKDSKDTLNLYKEADQRSDETNVEGKNAWKKPPKSGYVADPNGIGKHFLCPKCEFRIDFDAETESDVKTQFLRHYYNDHLPSKCKNFYPDSRRDADPIYKECESRRCDRCSFIPFFNHSSERPSQSEVDNEVECQLAEHYLEMHVGCTLRSQKTDNEEGQYKDHYKCPVSTCSFFCIGKDTSDGRADSCLRMSIHYMNRHLPISVVKQSLNGVCSVCDEEVCDRYIRREFRRLLMSKHYWMTHEKEETEICVEPGCNFQVPLVQKGMSRETSESEAKSKLKNHILRRHDGIDRKNKKIMGPTVFLDDGVRLLCKHCKFYAEVKHKEGKGNSQLKSRETGRRLLFIHYMECHESNSDSESELSETSEESCSKSNNSQNSNTEELVCRISKSNALVYSNGRLIGIGMSDSESEDNAEQDEEEMESQEQSTWGVIPQLEVAPDINNGEIMGQAGGGVSVLGNFIDESGQPSETDSVELLGVVSHKR